MGINTNPLNNRPNPLYTRASTVVVGIRAGVIILGRPNGLINGRRAINSNYTKTFRGIGVLE